MGANMIFKENDILKVIPKSFYGDRGLWILCVLKNSNVRIDTAAKWIDNLIDRGELLEIDGLYKRRGILRLPRLTTNYN